MTHRAIPEPMGRPAEIPSPWGEISVYRQRGRIRYRLRGPVNGERKSFGLYDTIEAAQEQAEALLVRYGDQPTELTTYGWAMQACDARDDRRLRDVKETRGLLDRHVQGHRIAGIPIRQLRSDVVRQWVHDTAMKRAAHGRREGQPLAQNTVRNALRALSAVCTDAVHAGRATRNPCLGVAVPKVPQDEEPWTYLTLDEVRAMLGHEKLTVPAVRRDPGRQTYARNRQHEIRTILTVAVYTGLREGELWGLRWSDVRLGGDSPELVVCRSYNGATKGGRPRRVPLLPPARNALASWRARDGAPRIAGLVWPGRSRAGEPERCHGEGYDAQWAATYRERLGVRDGVRFHDLRHTCASLLISGALGRPWRLEEVQILLGHQSRTTTERYAHLSPDSLAGAARETSSAIDSGNISDSSGNAARHVPIATKRND